MLNSRFNPNACQILISINPKMVGINHNILRKAIPNAFADGIEGFGVVPSIIKIEK